MSDNDLIRRGEVEDILCNAYDGTIDEGALAYLISELKKIPAVPQEMSASEYGDTLVKICASHNGRCADCEVEHPCAIPDKRTVPIVEKWAHEHPERSEE